MNGVDYFLFFNIIKSPATKLSIFPERTSFYNVHFHFHTRFFHCILLCKNSKKSCHKRKNLDNST